MLGEYDACKESLTEFRDFIVDNQLDNRNTLLRLNESLNTKKISLVNEFSVIAKKVDNLEFETRIDYNKSEVIEGNSNE